MKKKNIRILFEMITCISLGLGICLNLVNTSNILCMVSYFTIQSNFLSLVITFLDIVCELTSKKRKSNCFWKGMIVIMLLITMVTYHVALGPGFQMNPNPNKDEKKILADFLVHTLSPVLVISSYFLFTEKGNMKLYYPILWMTFPIYYVCYVYIHSYFGYVFYGIGGSRKFAYFFLDYGKIGLKNVILWLICLTIAIMFVSYILVFIDHRLGKNKTTV